MDKHQRRWFTQRIGKKVFREATAQTPASIRQNLIQIIVIQDKTHALSNYNYHKDYNINFKEIN